MAELEFKYLSKENLELLVNNIKTLVANAVAENAALDATEAQTRASEDARLEEAMKQLFAEVEYNAQDKKIVFKNGENILGEIDTTDFVKDGMVDDVKIEEGNLVITFNTESGKEEIKLSLNEIFNAENYYTKEEADDKFVKWGEYQGRKVLELNKRDTIAAEGVNIGMVSDYEGLDFPVVEIGSQKAALVLNSNDQPVKVEITENGKRVQHVVAYAEDIPTFVPFTEEEINAMFGE